MSLTDFHDLFKINLGKTRPDPNKVYTDKLKKRITQTLSIVNSPDMTLSDTLSSFGETSAIAKRLAKPFDLHALIKGGFKGELKDMLDELESMNASADFIIGFFGRRGSNMKDMIFTNSEMFLSNRFAYIRIPNPLSQNTELFLQDVEGFFENLNIIKK